MKSIRDICDVEFGIGRLADARIRQALYRRLTEIAPAERIPWHRLIRELLDAGSLEDTEYAIRDAEAAVGRDSPIDRYKVRLLVVRAQKTQGISDGDRVALLRRAYEAAMRNVDNYAWDKFSYRTLCEVAVQRVKWGENIYVLEEAIALMREAADRILDPEMARQLKYYEDIASREH